MQSRNILIVGAVVVLIVILGLCLRACKPQQDPNLQKLHVLQQQFDSLSLQIRSYKDSLKKYDLAISELKLRDSELTGKIEYNKSLQNQLKKEYAKANIRFDHYNSADIARYFADSLDN